MVVGGSPKTKPQAAADDVCFGGRCWLCTLHAALKLRVCTAEGNRAACEQGVVHTVWNDEDSAWSLPRFVLKCRSLGCRQKDRFQELRRGYEKTGSRAPRYGEGTEVRVILIDGI